MNCRSWLACDLPGTGSKMLYAVCLKKTGSPRYSHRIAALHEL
jgi:hypothetical protein